MSKISNLLTSLFWSLVLHVLIIVNFAHFFMTLLFGDLSVKAVPPPGPASAVQALESNPGGDQMDEVHPKDSNITASPLPCEPSPTQSPIVENHTGIPTQHESPHLAQAPSEDATSHPHAVQQHAAQPSTHTNIQAHLTDASSCRPEREEHHADASTEATHGQSQGGTSPSRDKTPPWLSFLSNGSPGDELHSVVPCWDLDSVPGEDSICPPSSNAPPSVGTEVALKVIQRATEIRNKWVTNRNYHLLQRAVHLLDHVIPLLRHDTLLATSLALQANCRHLLFESTRNISLLDRSIDAFQIVFGLQAWNVVPRGQTLVQCGRAFADRHEIRGDSGDLDRGIELLREGLEESGGTTSRDPSVVSRLGNLLLERHGKRWNDGDLNDAISLLGEALLLLTTDEPNRPVALNNLGCALITRYKRLGSISDVEEAIAHHREALSLRSGKHPDRPRSLSNLACTLVTRYKRLGSISDVEEAIAHVREALSLRSGKHPDRPPSLSNLASALVTRYERLGSISDVEEAIVHYREALSLRSGKHPDRPSSLSNLASTLVTRYNRLGSISDVEEAIAHLREALSLLSGKHPDRPGSLSNLASALVTRYERLGSISDVEEAIVHYREALSLRSGKHPDRPPSLSNLASALVTRYKRLGSISDVEEAIVHYREALSLRSGKHPDRPSSLSNLASILHTRSRMLGDVSNLGEAIGLLEEACKISHPDDPQQSGYLYNLATYLRDRMGDGDLDKAIALYEKALSLRRGNHPDRPGTLESLGRALLARDRNASDVETGMRYIEEALSLFPSTSPDRQSALLNLLIGFSEKADETVLRDRCIELARLTPQEHVGYSKMTSLVAPILHACHDTASELLAALGLDPNLNAEDATLALLQKGSRSIASPSTDQLKLTCDWIILSEGFGRPRSLEMYRIMLEHLDLAVSRSTSLDIRRRQLSDDHVLQMARGLVSDGVAFAIEQGEIETAVEFLERGRSVLLAQLSIYRVSSGLEAVAPNLAARFNSLSWEVESATFTGSKGFAGTGGNNPFEDSISRAARLRREWGKVVEEIRALDGFQHFLRPTPFADLQKAAAKGPVILINISKLRSDAVIVFSDHPPTVVPLPEVTPTSINHLVELFKMGSDPYDPLRSLWDDIVEPIVSTLETMDGAVPKSKRIWWCPSGSLTTLPLHAAGDYVGKRGRRLPDMYVSSYTPTLSALSRARQGRSGPSGVPSLLLVGQHHTPGQKLLPAVPEEIARVKETMPHATVIEDELGTRGAVLSAMTGHRWVHLSCHGKVEKTNPLQSHFALHDGPLPLLELIQNRLPHAELAFLSCCHSASGDSIIPDEFLHLAVGMQFAGFKSVVGTMWAMNDAVGPTLADEFYRRLLKQGKGDNRYSAKALNDALKVLRLKGVPSEEGPLKVPLRVWINFVHWGA